jgi:uncharacterized protein (TIGR00299 family) protein
MAHEGHEHEHEYEHEHESSVSRSSFDPPVQRTLEGCARVLHIDPVGGAAGDMLIAAFLDLGVPREVIESAVAATGLTGYRLDFSRRTKHAIVATGFDVVIEGDQPARDYAAIAALLAEAKLPPRVREIAERVFLRLGEAEAKIHRQPLARVHFHEVGGVDAIVDVVGASAALAYLESEHGALGISLGPLPIGAGIGKSAHGSIPLPAPATLELMIGLPVRDPGFMGETVTPTGAALLRGFTELLPSQLGKWVQMIPRAIGYGAGTRDFPDRANVVRLVLGELFAANATKHVVLEANVDDVTGEVAAAAIEALFDAGALDAWAQPITMKKGRPAMTVSAIAPRDAEIQVSRALLAHTGSLGVRKYEVSRDERPRRFVDVSTAYGTVRVKIADGDGLPVVVHPELEVCRERAREHRVPVREVIRAAIAAAQV